jgi:hypothetical protein
MSDKKQKNPLINKTVCTTIKNQLKGVITTFSVWGWLPLGFAKWILDNCLVKNAFKCRAGSETSKHSDKVV